MVARRRVWFWRWWAKIAWFFLLIIFAVYAVQRAQVRHRRREHRRLGAGHLALADLEAPPERHDARDPLQLLHLLRLQLRDPDGPAALHGHLADPRLRAGRRGLGREARRRARPGRGEGGGAARRQPLAVRRGLREGRRPARARAALPRRARHRQDDARQGDRDRLQLADRDHPGLRLRADLHGDGRGDRPLHGPQGEEAGAQVGRPVHRLHRRDRRRRHAPPVARRGSGPDDAAAAELPRPLLPRPERRADRERGPDPRVARLARAALRRAQPACRAADARSSAGSRTRSCPGCSAARAAAASWR